MKREYRNLSGFMLRNGSYYFKIYFKHDGVLQITNVYLLFDECPYEHGKVYDNHSATKVP